MKEELPGAAKRRNGLKLVSETNGFKGRTKDSVTGPKINAMPSKAAVPARDTRLKRNNREGMASKKDDQPTARRSIRSTAGTEIVPLKNGTEAIMEDVHEVADPSATKSSLDITKLRNSQRSGRLSRLQKPATSWAPECNSHSKISSSVDNELRQLRIAVKEFKDNEERLYKELDREKNELNMALLKIFKLENDLEAKDAEVRQLNATIEMMKAKHTANTGQQLQTRQTPEITISNNQEMGKRETNRKCSPSPVMLKAHLPELRAKINEIREKSVGSHKEVQRDDIKSSANQQAQKDENKSFGVADQCQKSSARNGCSVSATPPLPPPPPPLPTVSNRPFSHRVKKQTVQKSAQVIELYRSLMKQDAKPDSSINNNRSGTTPHSSMIGEIANRSAHLLAIKEDVRTKGDLVRSLIKDVQSASFSDIEDVLSFNEWLDSKLSVLVDEIAVLKHFDWPEKKADTLREAALGYRNLKLLESETLSYEDDCTYSFEVSSKKISVLLDKLEKSTSDLVSRRDEQIRLFKEFCIPTHWMLDTGMIKKLKIASAKLARQYMKRISIELKAIGTPEKEAVYKALVLQGVRFAFRVHQFAGGFDEETMGAFEDLKARASYCHSEEQPNLLSSATTLNNNVRQTAPPNFTLSNKICCRTTFNLK